VAGRTGYLKNIPFLFGNFRTKNYLCFMLSVCIGFKNDFDEIDSVIKNLLDTAQSDDFEIIVYNDGSVYGSGQPRPLELNYPKVRVINASQSFGIGYAFDRATEQAKGEIIVLMGADVYPREGWYEQVKVAVENNSRTLGCACCVGLNPSRMSLDDPDCTKRYGADLLFTVGNDDLPKNSQLRQRKGGYTDLFHAKWLPRKQSDEPYEIPCILGAFYFTSKAYYQELSGWDTVYRNRYVGHRVWSHLEPYISLKVWLSGGSCVLYPSIEAGHIFGRIDIYNQFSKGARSAEWVMWNSIFILETMILSDSFRHRLEDFMHPELNWNVAKKMIKDHWAEVQKVKERNTQLFVRDHTIFTEKFGYSFDI
jgi:glycosyltransferase involved in cell wall biosynthesis